ncbi:MAG: DNA helicase IV [Vibrio sp.]
MELRASKTAQFLITNEYYEVVLDKTHIVLSSIKEEEHIPFQIWNGCVRVHHGLFWGTLQFYAHERNGEQQSWLVQGLPWPQCRDWAEQAVATYQAWHQEQCQQLNHYLPQWQQELTSILSLSSFLPHSLIAQWTQRVNDDMSAMRMTLEETEQRIPQAMQTMMPWLVEPSKQLTQRNDAWVEQEKPKWQSLFKEIESSPLNESQQKAVLLNDDHNLVLAGAGSGKTSVLVARIAYLLASGLARPEDILLVAFGKQAAIEMQERIEQRIGERARGVQVSTFHQLGLSILKEVDGQEVTLSPVAAEPNLKQAWCIDWLKRHWMTPTNFKRWQKHLSKWPIAYLTGDDELGSQVENPKLIAWLVSQLDNLSQLALKKKTIQENLIDHPDYTRLNSELNLCWPCYQEWQRMLKESGQVDFNLMINRATQYVSQSKYTSAWQCIMVDEYQDISPARLDLLQALCEQRPQACNLFAVGDDWQAIYQFTGSNVNLTTQFHQYFPHSTVHYLDTTYRFNEQIGAVANTFIQKNPNQIQKPLISYKAQKQKAVYVMPTNQIEKVLAQLNRKSDGLKTVLILGRNHYHEPELLKDWQNQYLSLKLNFMTCHASKGKEADYVIIVGVDEMQFPMKSKNMHLDTALNYHGDEYPFAEERRLFYVALTRAKDKVWITHNGTGSSFVQELVTGDYPVVNKK